MKYRSAQIVVLVCLGVGAAFIDLYYDYGVITIFLHLALLPLLSQLWVRRSGSRLDGPIQGHLFAMLLLFVFGVVSCLRFSADSSQSFHGHSGFERVDDITLWIAILRFLLQAMISLIGYAIFGKGRHQR